jgi:hypothetical protein
VWSASRPGRLYPRERPVTHRTGGWVGPGAGLDRCGKSRPTGIRSPDLPARSESLYRLSYPDSPLCIVQSFYSKRWWFIYFLLYVFECKTILHTSKTSRNNEEICIKFAGLFQFWFGLYGCNDLRAWLPTFVSASIYGSGAWLPGHTPRSHGFSTGPVPMRFVVGKVVLGQDFFEILRFSLVSTMPPMVHTHSFILYWCCAILIIYSVVKQKKTFRV